eukprot:35489-Eustigmatos_ZCMA.PRE.1
MIARGTSLEFTPEGTLRGQISSSLRLGPAHVKDLEYSRCGMARPSVGPGNDSTFAYVIQHRCLSILLLSLRLKIDH